MPGLALKGRIHFGWLVVAFVVFIFAVDGEFSRTEALDRWVGTANISAQGVTLPVVFTVLVNPGVGASFEWRFRNVQIFTGGLGATVSGSRVTGTLFPTGGAAAQADPLCCRPCNFKGTIVGNRVDGTFDPVSCGGDGGTFFLEKQ